MERRSYIALERKGNTSQHMHPTEASRLNISPNYGDKQKKSSRLFIKCAHNIMPVQLQDIITSFWKLCSQARATLTRSYFCPASLS